MDKTIASILAVILAFFNLFGLIFDYPTFPRGGELDIDRFDLVFSDEFDGTELDTSVWSGHYTYGTATSVRRGGYWNRELLSFRDGNLVITTKYLDSGVNENDNPGWYSCAIDTNKGGYEQTYGYFETRCILPEGSGLWSAFWMLTDGMSDETLGGENGAEIDIFESPYYFEESALNKNVVSSTVHIDGYGDAHQQEFQGEFIVSGNPYKEYNTYGVEWNEEEYIFYINGVQTARTSFGVSKVPEYLILSVEVGGENGVAGDSWAGNIEDNGRDFVSEFVIDYVRCYQYK